MIRFKMLYNLIFERKYSDVYKLIRGLSYQVFRYHNVIMLMNENK